MPAKIRFYFENAKKNEKIIKNSAHFLTDRINKTPMKNPGCEDTHTQGGDEEEIVSPH